jgi:hypothetical protein
MSWNSLSMPDGTGALVLGNRRALRHWRERGTILALVILRARSYCQRRHRAAKPAAAGKSCLGNTHGAVPVANGGTGAGDAATARSKSAPRVLASHGAESIAFGTLAARACRFKLRSKPHPPISGWSFAIS